MILIIFLLYICMISILLFHITWTTKSLITLKLFKVPKRVSVLKLERPQNERQTLKFSFLNFWRCKKWNIKSKHKHDEQPVAKRSLSYPISLPLCSLILWLLGLTSITWVDKDKEMCLEIAHQEVQYQGKCFEM